jgi:hypothetical protein
MVVATPLLEFFIYVQNFPDSSFWLHTPSWLIKDFVQEFTAAIELLHSQCISV